MPPISSQAATAADFGPESVELPGSSSSWVPVPCREDGGPSDQNPSGSSDSGSRTLDAFVLAARSAIPDRKSVV